MTYPNDTASIAATYVARGWAVVPVRAGAKLPIETDWPNKGRRTAAEVQAAWTLYPDANVGIVTGLVSGLWVLDIDPGNGGMQALAGLVAAYGQLPETYVVRTPSGGLHYYFLLPADFEPRNAQHGRRAGRLPVGIDVRGRGGQVVAPPSSRPEGVYTVLADFPLSPAPEWLLDMLRPVEPVAAPTPTVPDGAALLASASVSHLWDSWLTKVFAEELERLARAPEGARDDVAFGVAVRLVEICNSDWNVVTLDDAYPHFMQACAVASANGSSPYTAAEADQKWRNAIGRRAGLGVPPPPPLGITGTAWTPPVFPPGISDASSNGGAQSDFDQAGQDPANPFTSPGAGGTSMQVAEKLINGPIEQGEVASAWESAVSVELSRLLVREEAGRRAKARNAVVTDFDQVALDDAGMEALPPAVSLVEGWLEMDCLARINGPSGHGKSFVVLDFGACVSTGQAWHGRPVTRTEVCYIVAEGARGTAKRARAWCQRHGLDSTGITFVPRPVQIGGPEWEALKAWCIRRRFGLIIFDTQARSTVGVDENDSTEMGQVIADLDEIKVATGACCMLVHHRGLRGDLGRGSSAVRGAMDTELDVTRQGTTITLKSTKQKDGTDPESVRFTMNPLGDSVVLIGETEASLAGPFTSPTQVPMSLRERCAVAIARALMDAVGSGLTRSEAQTHARVALQLGSDDSTKRVVRRGWSDLMELGRIAKASGREAYFFIDMDGAPVLAANPDKVVQGGPEVYIP
jgi:hypothetical protein